MASAGQDEGAAEQPRRRQGRRARRIGAQTRSTPRSYDADRAATTTNSGHSGSRPRGSWQVLPARPTRRDPTRPVRISWGNAGSRAYPRCVPAPGEVVVVVVIGLAVLLSLRIGLAVPGWIRRIRRPETRAIRVVGVGGGGNNAVDRMVNAGVKGVSFVGFNTDAQALRRPARRRRSASASGPRAVSAPAGIPTWAGGRPRKTRNGSPSTSAGADLVFVTAGLGGGTGSGAAPIVAASARDQGALTIGVVTKPFAFEGSQRRRVADAAAAELADHVDALIVVPNDRVGRRPRRGHLDGRRVRGRRRRAAPRGPGDHRPDQRAGADQPRLRRCPIGDAERRARGHRPGSGQRRAPRHRRRPSGDRQPAARGEHRGRPRDPAQRLRPGRSSVGRGPAGGRRDPGARRRRRQHLLRGELQRVLRRRRPGDADRHRAERPRARVDAAGTCRGAPDRDPAPGGRACRRAEALAEAAEPLPEGGSRGRRR